MKAKDILAPLFSGFCYLIDHPELRSLDSSNGWGTYDQFVDFVREYLAACIANPQAEVRVYG